MACRWDIHDRYLTTHDGEWQWGSYLRWLLSLVCCRGALVRVEVRPLLPQWQHNLLYVGNLANDGDAHIYLRGSAITSFAWVPTFAIFDIGPKMTAWRCHLGGGGKAKTTGVGPSSITSTSLQTYYKIITISFNYKHNFNHSHPFIHSQSTNHQSQFTSYPPFIFCISHFKLVYYR